MMWEEWAIIFSPLGKKLFCFPTEPPAILSLSAMFEFLPRSHISIGLSHLENHNFYDFHDITIQFSSVQFNSIQLLSHVWLFVTPWTAAHQASLSITNSQSLFILMSIKSVMPSNRLILCLPLLLLLSIFPSIRVFSNILCIRWPKYWSFSLSISLSNEYSELIPLGLTGLISLQSKGYSRVFSNTTVQKHQFFGTQLSL